MYISSSYFHKLFFYILKSQLLKLCALQRRLSQSETVLFFCNRALNAVLRNAVARCAQSSHSFSKGIIKMSKTWSVAVFQLMDARLLKMGLAFLHSAQSLANNLQPVEKQCL